MKPDHPALDADPGLWVYVGLWFPARLAPGMAHVREEEKAV